MDNSASAQNTILIVEDDKNLVRVLQIVLSARGYSLITARNGVEGLAQVTDGKPDLIITDISMPLMDGIEFCRRLRETSNAPIIVLSGEKNPAKRLDVLRAGADEFVPKPCDMALLQDRIKSWLRAGNPRVKQEGAQ